MLFNSTLRSLLKKLALAFGIAIKRSSGLDNHKIRLVRLMGHSQVSVVFDIGANSGQFASALREEGYKAKIISFEPLSAAHAQLSKKSKRDINWIVHPRVAISDRTGKGEINISENSVSSSLQPMMSIHLETAPMSRYVATESVQFSTLDAVFLDYENHFMPLQANLMLKLDVQGHEFTILENCRNLHKFAIIVLELSPSPMYEGEKDMHFMSDWLAHRGYDLWALAPVFADDKSGRILQYDGVFVHRKLNIRFS